MKPKYLAQIILLLFCFIEVYSQSIITYKNNDLSFGDVFIGYSEDVLHTDVRAAQFYFYHTKFFRSDLLVSFKLPNNLLNGKDKLPIDFSSSSAAWAFYGRETGRNVFNPKSPLEIRGAFFYFPVYLWLGGKITTNSGLSPGNYNGTISLTIEFL